MHGWTVVAFVMRIVGCLLVYSIIHVECLVAKRLVVARITVFIC